MSIRWIGAIEQRRLELIKDGLRYNQIARILSKEFGINVTSRAVEGRGYSTRTQKIDLKSQLGIDTFANMDEMDEMDEVDDESIDKLFPDECYQMDPDICMTPEKLTELTKIYKMLTDLNPKKILSLSDLHSPYINFKAVETAIKANPDADICLLNGDVYDGSGMSTYDKLSEIDIDDELKQVFMLLDVLTKQYKKVVWLGGNHDLGRFLSFVMKNFGAGMKKYVLKRLNPIDYIAEKYDNLIVVPHDWIEIGDVIFAHLKNYSAVDMKTVVTNNEIFYSMRDLLPNPDYKAVIIGHTHQYGKVIKNGTLLIEQGCLCHLYDYKFMKPTKNKWQTAYATVIFDKDMHVDFNKTNPIYV
jgi:predicted phosphodiesterase